MMVLVVLLTAIMSQSTLYSGWLVSGLAVCLDHRFRNVGCVSGPCVLVIGMARWLKLPSD